MVMEVIKMGELERLLTRLSKHESVDAAKEARRRAVELTRQQQAAERARLREQRKRPCGAKTRAGHPCRAKGLGRGGRCRNHGGLCTGPRTQAGRERIAAAQRRRWEAWRAEKQ